MQVPSPDNTRIALDLDSTVYPFVNAICAVEGGEAVRPERIRRYQDIQHHLLGDPREIYLRACSRTTARAIGIFPDAARVLQGLASDGIAIVVMTARDERLRPDTLAYLRDHEIPVGELHIAPDIDKVRLCRERGIEVIVDDAPYIIEPALEAGMSVLSIDHPYLDPLRERSRLSIAPRLGTNGRTTT